MSPSFRTATRTVPAVNGDDTRPSATAAAHSALYCSASTVVMSKCALRPPCRYSSDPLRLYVPSGSGWPCVMLEPCAAANVADQSTSRPRLGYPLSSADSSALIVCDKPVCD